MSSDRRSDRGFIILTRDPTAFAQIAFAVDQDGVFVGTLVDEGRDWTLKGPPAFTIDSGEI